MIFRKLRRRLIEDAIDDAAEAVQDKVEEKKVDLIEYLPLALAVLPVIDILGTSINSYVPVQSASQTINNFTFNIESINIKLS